MWPSADGGPVAIRELQNEMLSTFLDHCQTFVNMNADKYVRMDDTENNIILKAWKGYGTGWLAGINKAL